MIFENVFTFDESDDAPVNGYFDQMGYSSENAIKNMGSGFIYLVVNLFVLMMILPLVTSYNRNSVGKSTRCLRLEQSLRWNFFVRFFL